MEVNRETEALCALLEQSPDLLSEGGRLVIVTYHSLEDRLVKHFMKAGNVEGTIARDFYGNTHAPLRPVGRMIRPSVAEVETNSRARSAKLRIAERETQDTGDNDPAIRRPAYRQSFAAERETQDREDDGKRDR
jgi:16S rRNA (cytosine1402-N4)-methyltransferase